VINSVSSSTHAQAVARATASYRESAQSKPDPSSSTNRTDTVQLSSAAKAALEESSESSAQQAQEAHQGGER
jgi:hypothetical protein